MQPDSRTVSVLALISTLLVVAAPSARAQDSCNLAFHGFSADGKKFVTYEECMGSRTATLKVGTLATGRKVKVARGSRTYTKAEIRRHARVRPLRLQPVGSNPGWKVHVKKRGSRFTFVLRKGSKRIRLGTRTFRRTRAIVASTVYWERNLRGVVLRVTIHRGVSGHAPDDLIGFRVKGQTPTGASRLMLEGIPSCRVLVALFRCMVRVTPVASRAAMQRTADKAIADMEGALRRKPAARSNFSRSCATQSGKLRTQFRRNAIYGKCMR